MTFDEILTQVLELLRRDGRVSYRALKRRFDLDDDYLEDLKAEIIQAKKLAVDEDGAVLVCTGDFAAAPTPASAQERPPLSYTPAYLAEKILTSRAALEGERKQVTVLFADLLGRVVRGAIEAFVGILVLDELFYRLLLARVKDATGRNPLEVLRADLPGTIAAHGNAIDTALRKLMALPHVHLISVETADFHGMLDSTMAYGLLPCDALHVTVMQRVGLTVIASDDTDFDRVAMLTRHWIINPPTNA